jgi:hypothetical protein
LRGLQVELQELLLNLGHLGSPFFKRCRSVLLPGGSGPAELDQQIS